MGLINHMPKVYVLVGVPGSGKSTWIAQQDWARDCSIVSTDHWIEVFARELGRTYSEVFDLFMPAAVRAMSAQVALAQQQGRDIVWDQTSVSVASRAKKFASLPDYEHVAVVFATPEPAELARRLAQRPGKVIPESVVQHMINTFELPTESEGYREIWTAQ
jgi:predicted kinase